MSLIISNSSINNGGNHSFQKKKKEKTLDDLPKIEWNAARPQPVVSTEVWSAVEAEELRQYIDWHRSHPHCITPRLIKNEQGALIGDQVRDENNPKQFYSKNGLFANPVPKLYHPTTLGVDGDIDEVTVIMVNKEYNELYDMRSRGSYEDPWFEMSVKDQLEQSHIDGSHTTRKSRTSKKSVISEFSRNLAWQEEMYGDFEGGSIILDEKITPMITNLALNDKSTWDATHKKVKKSPWEETYVPTQFTVNGTALVEFKKHELIRAIDRAMIAYKESLPVDPIEEKSKKKRKKNKSKNSQELSKVYPIIIENDNKDNQSVSSYGMMEDGIMMMNGSNESVAESFNDNNNTIQSSVMSAVTMEASGMLPAGIESVSTRSSKWLIDDEVKKYPKLTNHNSDNSKGSVKSKNDNSKQSIPHIPHMPPADAFEIMKNKINNHEFPSAMIESKPKTTIPLPLPLQSNNNTIDMQQNDDNSSISSVNNINNNKLKKTNNIYRNITTDNISSSIISLSHVVNKKSQRHQKQSRDPNTKTFDLVEATQSLRVMKVYAILKGAYGDVKKKNSDEIYLFIELFLRANKNDLLTNNLLPEAVKYETSERKKMQRILQFYVDFNFDVNKINRKDGNNVIHYAAKANNAKMLLWCIKNKAKIDLLSRHSEGDDMTACMIAAKYGYIECLELLMRNEADVNHKNSIGHTALHIACKNGQTRIALFLLRVGANKKLMDNAGHRASKLAELSGYFVTAQAVSCFAMPTLDVPYQLEYVKEQIDRVNTSSSLSSLASNVKSGLSLDSLFGIRKPVSGKQIFNTIKRWMKSIHKYFYGVSEDELLGYDPSIEDMVDNLEMDDDISSIATVSNIAQDNQLHGDGMAVTTFDNVD
eukprot:gene13517-18135_t